MDSSGIRHTIVPLHNHSAVLASWTHAHMTRVVSIDGPLTWRFLSGVLAALRRPTLRLRGEHGGLMPFCRIQKAR